MRERSCPDPVELVLEEDFFRSFQHAKPDNVLKEEHSIRLYGTADGSGVVAAQTAVVTFRDDRLRCALFFDSRTQA